MATTNAINANGTTPLIIGHGGTGVTSVTTAPAATAFAGWDANSNLSANNHIAAYTTTATAAGTTVLSVASTYQQYFTGSTTQTVTLPVTGTLVLGQQFYIANSSTGVVTVQSSGGNTIIAMAAGSVATYTCILTSGTTATSWATDYTSSSPTGTGGLKSFQIFTTGTAQTYTKPSNITSILVEVLGGGGAGGGATSASNSFVGIGAGGGSGGYSRLYIASAASTYTYTVGAGGTAGTAGNNPGNTGGTTTFGASLQATGGTGGTGGPGTATTANANSLGGAAGVGSNGNVNAQGQAGFVGVVLIGGIGFSGAGGSSYYSGGASSINAGASNGTAGGNYGSGGSGGIAVNGNQSGGAGSSGLIVVWEYS